MRVIVQRAKRGEVRVEDRVVGQIDEGLVLLVGFTQDDTYNEVDYMVDKVINLRIFDDENGIMNKSLIDIKGSILSISQFTLYADARKGRRPNYIKALNGKEAEILYALFNQKLKDKNIKVETGIFGADMEVELINDGPVTIALEKERDNVVREQNKFQAN